MTRKYEDVFMELQSEFIALCLEVAEQDVDEIYAYCSIEKKAKCLMLFLRLMEK